MEVSTVTVFGITGPKGVTPTPACSGLVIPHIVKDVVVKREGLFNLAFFSLGRLRSNLGNDPAGAHQAIWNFGGIAVVSHQITVIPSRVLIAGHRIYDPEACRRRMRMFHHRIKHAVSENRIPGDSSRHRHNFLDDLYSLMGIGGSYRNPDTDCMGRRRDIFQNSLICEFETASMLRSLSYQREGQEEKKACKE